jgi:hypothetical protein
VRWCEVAASCGVVLRPDACFHSVALPPSAPARSDLPDYTPPRRGQILSTDVAALIPLLRQATDTPDNCFFAIWEGYAWQGLGSDPIPQEVMGGPKLAFAGREYAVYLGPLDAASVLAEGDRPAPNIWWPADRAWCLVSEVDLPWTYLAGSADLISAVQGDYSLEVLPVDLRDPVRRVEEWIQRLVSSGADRLMRDGYCRLETTRGAVVAWFERPGLHPGHLGITSETTAGRRTERKTSLEHRSDEEMRRMLMLHLTLHVIDLVEG